MSAPAPVVAVHGLYGTLDADELLAGLRPREILAVDLLGYGRYPATPGKSLEEQADHVMAAMTGLAMPAVLVGHSLGGAVAVCIAERYPDRVAGLISIEGNMRPEDAFFSASLANMTMKGVAGLVADAQADPAAWLRSVGLAPTPKRVALARSWMARQTPAALRAAARSVVDATFAPEWPARLDRVLDRTPYALLAGERSAASWAVPDHIRRGARADVVVPGTGHFLPTEAPAAVGAALGRLAASL
jgi:pimeloyl-ACP methyl ester carboxylesterase